MIALTLLIPPQPVSSQGDNLYMQLLSHICAEYADTYIAFECLSFSISLDHQLILGATEDKIAWQKAGSTCFFPLEVYILSLFSNSALVHTGIMKPNCDVFTPANQLPQVMDVFRSEAKSVNARLHEVMSSQAQLTSDKATIESSELCSTQVDNACIAAAVLKHLGIPTDGMSQFYWPCRMETFTVGKNTVILDGCHNGDSVQKFLSGIKSIQVVSCL
jgi:folylpolyglutamate synthase/dihydropteroate synthase